MSEVNSEIKSDEYSDKMADQEVVAIDADATASPAVNLSLVEGGKKDPHVRRQELLVDSGLAEVCGFFYTSKFGVCTWRIFCIIWMCCIHAV